MAKRRRPAARRPKPARPPQAGAARAPQAAPSGPPASEGAEGAESKAVAERPKDSAAPRSALTRVGSPRASRRQGAPAGAGARAAPRKALALRGKARSGAKQAAPLPFMAWRKHTAVASAVLLLIAVGALAIRGLSFGLDFTGGTELEVGYRDAADLSEIRQRLSAAGMDKAVVVHFGSSREALIRLPKGGGDEMADKALRALSTGAEADPPELRRVEFVGPQIGEELREKGGMALLAALLLVMLYVAFRFQLKFSIGAVVAVAHDVLITLGAFALFGWNFDLTVLAALLAVIGYSLNDSIVVSDRIRERFRGSVKPPMELIDIALSQTLGRTVVTSLTTLLVLVALATLGGELIRGFALALIIGVLVGTYSSIYVVTNVLLLLGIQREELLVPEKEGQAEDPRAPARTP